MNRGRHRANKFSVRVADLIVASVVSDAIATTRPRPCLQCMAQLRKAGA